MNDEISRAINEHRRNLGDSSWRPWTTSHILPNCGELCCCCSPFSPCSFQSGSLPSRWLSSRRSSAGLLHKSDVIVVEYARHTKRCLSGMLTPAPAPVQKWCYTGRRSVVVVYPLPWPLLVGGVRCSRLWSTSQLLRPSGQQCGHSGGVCPQIQGRQCGAYVGAVEEMMCVVCVDVTEGA